MLSLVLNVLLCPIVIHAAFLEDMVENHVDITDRYIVTLKPEADITNHVAFVNSLDDTSKDGLPFAGVTAQFNIGDYHAYAGHFNASVLDRIRKLKDVEDVEPDQVWGVTAFPKFTITQTNSPVGLTLISHRGLREDNNYVYDRSDGKNTFGYVIDTGIDVDHPQFGGRAYQGFNIVRGHTADDRVGHGTHVAGIIGSETYGVAKRCTLIAVKVLEGMSGSMSDIQEGLDWAMKDIVFHKRQKTSVINMSLGGPLSRSFNKAVETAVNMGVNVVVAAGNSDDDASMASPASAEGVISVAATNRYRTRAPFSNWGTNVTIFAPGVDIVSTWPGNETKSLSGTSMASPFVAGLVLYLQGIRKFSNPKKIRSCLLRIATAKVVADAHSSPNAFAYNNGGSQLGLWG